MSSSRYEYAEWLSSLVEPEVHYAASGAGTIEKPAMLWTLLIHAIGVPEKELEAKKRRYRSDDGLWTGYYPPSHPPIGGIPSAGDYIFRRERTNSHYDRVRGLRVWDFHLTFTALIPAS